MSNRNLFRTEGYPGCDGTQLPRTALPLNPDQAELVEKWCRHRSLDLLEPELAFLVCLLGDRAFSLAQAFYDAGFGAGAQHMLRRWRESNGY